MQRVANGVQESNRYGTQAFPAGGGKRRGQMCLVQRLQHGAVGGEPFASLERPRVEHGGQPDIPGEDVRAVLVTDAQDIAQAPGDHQQGGRAAAFEQRVGGDRRAEADRFDR